MQKIKINFSNLGLIVKSALIGIVSTLLGIVVFSVVLKFVDLSSITISYVNALIKAISIFVTILCIKRKGVNKLLFNSVLAGIVYAILSFVIFSILNGQFILNMSVVVDLLFAIIVSIISAVIFSTLKRKTM